MTDLFSLENVTYCWPDHGRTALHEVSLRAPRGSRVALLGHNGCGKSTLLLHLNGILRPTRGSVRLGEVPLSYSAAALRALRGRVALVFQEPDDQFFGRTVLEDAAFSLLARGVSQSEARARAEVEAHGMGLGELLDESPYRLSFGQKKRLALAAALVLEPEALVLDEPTTGLDAEGLALLERALAEASERGSTIVLSTHDTDFALSWANWAWILHEGGVVFCGPATEALFDEELLVRAGVRVPQLARFWNRLRPLHEASHPPRSFEELCQKVAWK